MRWKIKRGEQYSPGTTVEHPIYWQEAEAIKKRFARLLVKERVDSASGT
jgi:hypothetical protein